MDGIEWTPWGTLLFAEEAGTQGRPDPDVPGAIRGLVYEATFAKNDPSTVATITVRPALGSLAHEGIAVDAFGNVYVIDEVGPKGGIFKFVPDRRGNLSSGQLYATLSDPGAEDTGIYFGEDPGVLFVNVQHSTSGNDKTMVIYKKGSKSITTSKN